MEAALRSLTATTAVPMGKVRCFFCPNLMLLTPHVLPALLSELSLLYSSEDAETPERKGPRLMSHLIG